MNVLSQASTGGTLPLSAASPPGTSVDVMSAAQPVDMQAGQGFAQVWGQHAAQMLAAVTDLPLEQSTLSSDTVIGAQVQTFPVALGDVLPALHLPAQQMSLEKLQQRAAQAALGLVEGETLDTDAAQESHLPAMHTLSVLPVVHPQLRREAVSTVDASSAPAALLLGNVTEAVSLSTAAAHASGASISTPLAGTSASNEGPATSHKSSAPALVQALGQRIQLQQVQGQDVVTVRLDPPQWGRIEIRIQQDAAGMQVVLQASHAEVGRQLTSVADALRQELQARTSGEASVVVAHSQRSMAGQGQGERQAQQGDEAWQGDAPVGQALQFDMGDDAV